MSAVHIIAAYAIAILLVGLYLAVNSKTRRSRISDEKDFFTVFYEGIDKHVRESFINIKTDTFLILSGISAVIVAIAVFFLTGNAIICVGSGVLGLFVPELFIYLQKNSAKKKFDERYARSLEQLSSSLRAGLSIQQAVNDAAVCPFLHDDMRKRYARMSSDMQMGLSVTEAFWRFADETGSKDARDMAIAIDIQNEIGGREAEVVKEIATNIRDRMMLRKEVKTMFASTTAMVWIMDFICPGVVLWFSISNSDYSEVYLSGPLYMIILAAILIAMGIGSFVNHRTLSQAQSGA